MSWRPFGSVALAVAWRNLHNFFTNPALFLPGLIFPLFFFSAFAGGLSRISHVPGFHFASGYTAFEYVFVLFQASAFGGVFTGFSVARDYESGFARRLMLAAPQRPAIVVGYALSGLGRAAFTITLVTAVALAAGMQVGGDGVQLVTLYLLALTVN
jgi:ABC-2 type transport system permease protein